MTRLLSRIFRRHGIALTMAMAGLLNMPEVSHSQVQGGAFTLPVAVSSEPVDQPIKAPLKAHQHDSLGHARKVETSATLYRDGTLVLVSYTQARHLTIGCRARVFAVFVDAHGRKIGMSQFFSATTRGSRLDPACPSAGTDTFTQSLPAEVAELTVRIDIYHSDAGGGDIWNNLHNTIKEAVKTYEDLPAAVKAALP